MSRRIKTEYYRQQRKSNIYDLIAGIIIFLGVMSFICLFNIRMEKQFKELREQEQIEQHVQNKK